MFHTIYYRVYTWMLSKLNLSLNEALLYAYIFSYSKDGQSKCFSKLETIADSIGATRKTVKNNLSELLKKGLIIEHTKPGARAVRSFTCNRAKYRDIVELTPPEELRYISIDGWMLSEDLKGKLKGNKLLVFALIHGINLHTGNEFYDSKKAIATHINTDTRTAINVVNALKKDGLLIERIEDFGGEQLKYYSTSKSLINKVMNMSSYPPENFTPSNYPPPENFTPPSEKITPLPPENFTPLYPNNSYTLSNTLHPTRGGAQGETVGDYKSLNRERAKDNRVIAENEIMKPTDPNGKNRNYDGLLPKLIAYGLTAHEINRALLACDFGVPGSQIWRVVMHMQKNVGVQDGIKQPRNYFLKQLEEIENGGQKWIKQTRNETETKLFEFRK